MENNGEETNSTMPPNLDEKEKKSFPLFIVDASIIVLILTGLTYLIGMKFKAGYLGYYKIDTIMLSDVGMNYIINSVTGVIGLLMLWVVIFTLYLPALSSAKYIGRILYFIMSLFRLYLFVLAFSVYVFDKAIDEGFTAIVLWICIIILVPIQIFNFFIKKSNKKKSPLFEKLTNSIRGELNYIISDIKKKRYLKFVPLIPCIFLAIVVFDNLGETSAQRKENYLVIERGEKDFVVIAENKDNLLIAPVNLDEKVITASYSIIEAKSEINKLVKLKAKKFNGGLKVEYEKPK
ncbi:hypothetical protein ACFVSZ_28395 [Priestia megaterium]|uniref:hypothetical protein n=1 Tax=Priestia megaterium TaxID=1404 RepID=UPI0036DD6087